MKHLNERHTWFNLDKNEEYILRYTTKNGSMLTDKDIESISKYSSNEVVIHKYGVVVFKEPLTSIGHSAFFGCKGLTSINIPSSVTSIGDTAFWCCSGMVSVTIPDSVTSIGSFAFEDCNNLTNITYKGTKT